MLCFSVVLNQNIKVLKLLKRQQFYQMVKHIYSFKFYKNMYIYVTGNYFIWGSFMASNLVYTERRASFCCCVPTCADRTCCYHGFRCSSWSIVSWRVNESLKSRFYFPKLLLHVHVHRLRYLSYVFVMQSVRGIADNDWSLLSTMGKNRRAKKDSYKARREWRSIDKASSR